MNKEQKKESIEAVQKGLTASRENLINAQYHIEEGEIILKALQNTPLS